MTTTLRIAAIAGASLIASPIAAGAATLQLVPVAPAVAAPAYQCAVRAPAPASITDAEPADLPPIAAGQNVTGAATVLIDLDARGRLTDSAVLVSSGNVWIDRAALRSARLSRYSAEVRDCAPVGGVYAVVVDFTR